MVESVGNQQQQQAEGAQRRVSFEVLSNDHPLLTVRKRMKAGDNRHSVSTFGRSASITATGEITAAIDTVAKADNLRSLLEEAESLGLTQEFSSPSYVTPAPTTVHVSTVPTHTPPTPGRRHDIKWESEPPKFFPRPPAHVVPYSVEEQRKGDTETETMLSSPLPKVQLRPRFESSYLTDRLNMPSLSGEDPSGHPPIPFAPFSGDPADDESRCDSEEQENNNKDTMTVNVPSAASKLSEMSLSVSEAARQHSTKRYVRNGLNARCA